MTALDPELAQLVGNKKTQVDPELARLVAATPGVTPFPKAIAGLKRPGERVTATEIDEDLWRVMSPEQRDKALSRMEQTQLANVRKAEKGRALVEKFRRQQETKKAIGKVVTTPVNYALKAMLAPPGAVVKAIGEGARQARAGKAIGLADLGRYALQGAKEGTSLQEYKQELFPGRSPLEQTVLALAGDVTSGYAAVPVARGIAAGAKLVKPLVGAAAEATPFVGDVVRAGKQYQVMRQGIRAERLAELKRVQPIEALFDLRVRPHIETLASDITKTQGTVTNPAVQPPALTFDLAAARGNLARAKAREAAANKIVGRIEKQQRLGVQPTADIRQARAELETATRKLRAHDATWKNVQAEGGPVPWKAKYDFLAAQAKDAQARYDAAVAKAQKLPQAPVAEVPPVSTPPKTLAPATGAATQAEGARGGVKEPWDRTVGVDAPDTFLHGTAAKNIPSLTKEAPPVGSRKPRGKGPLSQIFPAEHNEFGADLLLAEPEIPHQALQFSAGRGEALAVIRLRPGTRVLDLGEIATRAGAIGLPGEPRYIHFFERPGFLNDFVSWRKSRISDRFKASHPDWESYVEMTSDPQSPGFDPYSWTQGLANYARDRGYGAIRFTDETLVVDRSALLDARKAKPAEVRAAEEARGQKRYRGLFADKPRSVYYPDLAAKYAPAEGSRAARDIGKARVTRPVATAVPGAQQARTGQAVPLSVARARGIQSNIVGERATAQTNLDRLRQTMKSQGRVPLSLRGVTFRLPQPGEKITEADTRNLIAALTERASPSGMALTPADAERELLGYADSLGLDTVKLQKAAAQARGLGKLYQSRIVAANVKTWDELQRIERQGGYLRRVYGRHLSEAEHLQWLDENGMRNVADRIRNARMNQPEIFYARAKAPVTKWNPRGNLPVKAQVALRPITDVIARLRAQTTVTKQILPRMEMFQRMAANPEMVGDVERTGWYYLSRSELTQRAERLRNLGWTDVADEVQSQAERNGWGALEGKYVSPQLYFALNPQSIDWGAKARDLPRQFANFAHSMLAPSIVHVPPSRVGAAGLYQKALHTFKGLATVYNAPGQVVNKIGNWMQVHAFGEVPASLVVPLEAAAAIDVARSSPFFYEVSKRLGSLAETGSLVDIMDTVQTIQRANAGDQSAIKTIALWAKNAPGKFWQMNEVTSKMAVIRYWLARGKSWDWAVNKAEAAVYHYSDVPRWIEWSRSFNPFLPFPTYAYKSVGQFWNAMWHHPDRINMYSRLKQAIESKTPKDERDAMNALLPDWEQEELPIILPGKDKYGRRQIQRSGRVTPWGSITPGDVLGRNPAIIGPLQELRTGKDEFGRDIANPEATAAEQITQRGAHLVTGVVPSLRPLEAFLKERKLAKERELKPERKPEKEPRTTLQTLTRVGVLDTPIARRAALGKLQNDLANLKKYQRDLEKTKGKGFASWERDDPDRARIMARRITIAEERRKVNAAARKLRSNH